MTVLSANNTLSGYLEKHQAIDAGTSALRIFNMLVEMKLWEAPLSIIAEVLVLPIATGSKSKFADSENFEAKASSQVQSCFIAAVVPLLSFLVLGVGVQNCHHFQQQRSGDLAGGGCRACHISCVM